MATIRAYSDLQQSKKLAKILPLESADMHWQYIEEDNGQLQWFCFPKDFSINQHDMVSAWSLASLLGVLPYCPDLSKHTDNKWYITTYPNGVHTCLMAYDNPIDACYEMVIRLNELKIL